MPLLPANVIRVDRTAALVEVMTVGLNRTVYAAYPDKKRPPPPLSRVFLEQQAGGQWIIRESPTLRRQIVTEDFTTASVGAATGALFADSIWTIEPAANYAFANPGIAVAGAYGTVEFYTQAVANDVTNVRKDDTSMTLKTDEAVWFSASVAPNPIANTSTIAGFANTAFTDYAYLQNNGGLVTFETSGGNLTLQFSTTNSVFFDIDIVCIPDASSSLWLNGDGPYTVVSTTSPGAGTGLEAFFQVKTTVNVTKLFEVDWCHVEAFTPVVHPNLLYGIGLSDTSAVGHSYLGTRT